MDDELETLLRDHYERAAGGIHADPALVRRYRAFAGGSTSAVWGSVRGWAVPAVAALATAIAILLTVVAFLRPSAAPAVPRPVAPPSRVSTPTPVPSPAVSAGPGESATPIPTVPGRDVPSSRPVTPSPATPSQARPDRTPTEVDPRRIP